MEFKGLSEAIITKDIEDAMERLHQYSIVGQRCANMCPRSIDGLMKALAISKTLNLAVESFDETYTRIHQELTEDYGGGSFTE